MAVRQTSAGCRLRVTRSYRVPAPQHLTRIMNCHENVTTGMGPERATVARCGSGSVRALRSCASCLIRYLEPRCIGYTLYSLCTCYVWIGKVFGLCHPSCDRQTDTRITAPRLFERTFVLVDGSQLGIAHQRSRLSLVVITAVSCGNCFERYAVKGRSSSITKVRMEKRTYTRPIIDHIAEKLGRYFSAPHTVLEISRKSQGNFYQPAVTRFGRAYFCSCLNRSKQGQSTAWKPQ